MADTSNSIPVPDGHLLLKSIAHLARLSREIDLPVGDLALIAAWAGRRDACEVINSSVTTADQKMAAQDQYADFQQLITTATAQSPQAAEVQLWTALHCSLAYSRDDDAAMLRMDLDHFERSSETYELAMREFLAVIRSLRAMSAIAEGGADA